MKCGSVRSREEERMDNFYLFSLNGLKIPMLIRIQRRNDDDDDDDDDNDMIRV